MIFMRSRPVFVASLLLLSAACGSETADTTSPASGDESVPMKLADGPPSDPEAELRLAESQMSTILAIAADAIISLNEHMRIVVFNEGASAIFGYTKDKIIGQPLEVLIPRALPHDTPSPIACAASSSSA